MSTEEVVEKLKVVGHEAPNAYSKEGEGKVSFTFILEWLTGEKTGEKYKFQRTLSTKTEGYLFKTFANMGVEIPDLVDGDKEGNKKKVGDWVLKLWDTNAKPYSDEPFDAKIETSEEKNDEGVLETVIHVKPQYKKTMPDVENPEQLELIQRAMNAIK